MLYYCFSCYYCVLWSGINKKKSKTFPAIVIFKILQFEGLLLISLTSKTFLYRSHFYNKIWRCDFFMCELENTCCLHNGCANFLRSFPLIFYQIFFCKEKTFWCFTKFFFDQRWNSARLLLTNTVYTSYLTSCQTNQDLGS